MKKLTTSPVGVFIDVYTSIVQHNYDVLEHKVEMVTDPQIRDIPGGGQALQRAHAHSRQ